MTVEKSVVEVAEKGGNANDGEIERSEQSALSSMSVFVAQVVERGRGVQDNVVAERDTYVEACLIVFKVLFDGWFCMCGTNDKEREDVLRKLPKVEQDVFRCCHCTKVIQKETEIEKSRGKRKKWL